MITIDCSSHFLAFNNIAKRLRMLPDGLIKFMFHGLTVPDAMLSKKLTSGKFLNNKIKFFHRCIF